MSASLGDERMFNGLVFDCGCLTGSSRVAQIIQRFGGVVAGALSQNLEGPTVNSVRPDAVSKQLCFAARRPVLHFSWIWACVESRCLTRPVRGIQVSVPPGYVGPLVVGGDGCNVFSVGAPSIPALHQPVLSTHPHKVADASPPPKASAAIRPKRQPFTDEDHATMIEWCVQ